MTYRLADVSCNAALKSTTGVYGLVDQGAGPGKLKIYSGAQPATRGTTPAGTLLAVLTFSDPAFLTASARQISADAITSGTGLGDALAGCFTVTDSDDNILADGLAGNDTDDPGADMSFGPNSGDNLIATGGAVSCSSFVVTQLAS